MGETQASIIAWADETFGESASTIRLLGRANTEMAELVRAVTSNEPAGRIGEEAADTAIVLCRAAASAGVTLSFDVTVSPGLVGIGALRHVMGANKAVAALLAEFARVSGPSRTEVGALMLRSFLYLAAACEAVGSKLQVQIDGKMLVNRQRVWVRGASQDEHHVRVAA